jgi:hypothetical protein
MSPEERDVWLDCDPGHDDALAIILAGRDPYMLCYKELNGLYGSLDAFHASELTAPK